MKKIILLFILIAGIGNAVTAQNLNQLITDLANIEGVQYQLIDKAMLNTQIEGAMATDSTGELKLNMPGFMQKIDQIEVAIVENGSDEAINKVTQELSKVKDENGYEYLLKVKQGEQDVRIIAKKGDNKSDIFIIVIANPTIVAMKMTGNLDEQDFIEIVKEQEKKQPQQGEQEQEQE